MGCRAVRRWSGKPGRRWWPVFSLTVTIADSWDDWIGQLALTGVDPQGWTLNTMLAAFETTMRQGAKDESEWRRMDAQLRAEPKSVRDKRRKDAAAGRQAARTGGIQLADAEA